MWLLLDRLNALIVAPAVAALAFGLYVATQEHRVETAARATQVGLLTQTVDWLERDLANLGAGAAGPAILAYAWHGDTPSVTFVTGADTSLAAPPDTIRYERAATATGFELRRLRVGAAGTQLTARSPATLHTFDVRLVGPGGAPAGAADARSLVVRAAMAAGSGPPVEWTHRYLLPRTSPSP